MHNGADTFFFFLVMASTGRVLLCRGHDDIVAVSEVARWCDDNADIHRILVARIDGQPSGHPGHAPERRSMQFALYYPDSRAKRDDRTTHGALWIIP